ncbi:MAG: hypothetical protein J0I79_16375 [Mesorhizobium sp.]|uniref:hypothetical protein n=1 Tax=Mesorhizobium sp. TaxID=1871066 RepID=UPI001AD0F481|nr:hypothetical protein [Mesorhizobium sp.]MBN9219522.1 hypothetical protein [Mesorhizobium sp.]
MAEVIMPGQHRTVRIENRDGPPKWLADCYKVWQPHYRYDTGIYGARLERIERWGSGIYRGKWVGIYVMTVQSHLGVHQERYAWCLYEGVFQQVKQMGMRSVAHREFVRV